MASHGLASSRSRAQRYIQDGVVRVNGRIAQKASMKVEADARVEVLDPDHYVSRGAYKLLGALEAFQSWGLPSPQGLHCLDIGASTGGFCDVLLRQGAAQVIALDVGHGQLNPRIAQDSRIIEMSGVNIRDVEAADLPFAPQYIVSDVSFISLTYVLPVIARIAAPGAWIILLIKPQFEVGRAGLDRHGIVTSEQLRLTAVDTVVQCAQDCGLRVLGTADSPIEGTHGNHEYLLCAQQP